MTDSDYLPFINREQDLDKILDDIDKNHENNKVVIISAKSGIGKSSFCGEVLRNVNSKPSIKLSLTSSRSKFQQDGYYLRELCILIDELSNSDSNIPSFSEFWAKNAPTEIATELGDFILKEFAKTNIITKSIEHLSKAIKKRAKFSAKSIFGATNNQIINHAGDYLEYVLSNVMLLINIENIQCIDGVSLEKLCSTLSQVNGQYLLLEFTLESGTKWSIEDLKKEFFDYGIHPELRSLERLSVDDIMRLFKNHPKAMMTFIKELYVESDGSLTALKHYNIRFNKNPERTIAYMNSGTVASLNQVTIDTVSELTNDQKLVLCLVGLHGDWVSVDLLKMFEKFISNSNPFLDIELVLKFLKDNQLVYSNDNFLQVRCDEKIQKLLERKAFTSVRVICLEFWRSTYQSLLNSDTEQLIPKSEVFYFLIYFNYISGEPVECLKLLDEISYFALQSYSPSRIISLLEEIRNKLSSASDISNLEKIDHRLVHILSYLSYSGAALKVVERLPDSGQKFIYKGTLLENNGQAPKAIETAKLLREQFGKSNIRYRAASDLIEFASLRALSRQDDCKILFHRMKNESAYFETFEYGFILRSAASVLSATDCINDVKESIAFFNNRGAKIQEGFSQIELCVAYAVLKKYDEALKVLNDCTSLMMDVLTERHTILNNRANLLMLKNGDLQEAYLLYKQAKYSATLAFDKLAISMNILIALSCVESDMAEQAVQRVLELIEAGGFQSKSIIRKAYYNIAVHYTLKQNDSLSNKYFDMMKAVNVKKRHVVNTSNIFPFDEYGSSVCEKPFSPVFMAHWNMEFDNFSENFLVSS